MKKDIHPQYNKEAKIKCACGAIFKIGSTKSEIQIEICGNCHPFFTGKEKLIDTMGRVERFKTRTANKKEVAKKIRVKKQK
ncbi:MAG: 50S ribosomal protein L31 [Patescibacteria group bacterium]